MGLAFGKQRIVDGTIGLILQNPFLGEPAALNFVEDLPHFLFRLFRDYTRAAGDVAVLGRRTDGIPHIGDAALVDQIDDQLHFMETFEIGHLRRVARLDEGVVSGLNEGREASAEHDLFTEEIGFRFLAEIRLDHAGTSAADGAGIGQPHLSRGTARILVNGQ